MGSDSVKANGSIAERIVAVQEKWHTKKHPFFGKMGEGALDLRSMGNYMAQHYKFVEMVLPSMGLLLWRAPEDIRVAMIENLAEEAGMAEDRNDHMEMIFRFCKAVGFGEDEVRTTQPMAAWWARALHYVHCCREEPLGVALAMQSTQEGQQVALNEERSPCPPSRPITATSWTIRRSPFLLCTRWPMWSTAGASWSWPSSIWNRRNMSGRWRSVKWAAA